MWLQLARHHTADEHIRCPEALPRTGLARRSKQMHMRICLANRLETQEDVRAELLCDRLNDCR